MSRKHFIQSMDMVERYQCVRKDLKELQISVGALPDSGRNVRRQSIIKDMREEVAREMYERLYSP